MKNARTAFEACLTDLNLSAPARVPCSSMSADQNARSVSSRLSRASCAARASSRTPPNPPGDIRAVEDHGLSSNCSRRVIVTLVCEVDLLPMGVNKASEIHHVIPLCST